MTKLETPIPTEQEPGGLATAIPGLYASTPETLPFAPSLDVRAFLLRRDLGNLLVYSVSTLESDAAAIEGLGGISRQYLNHSHEAMFASDWAGRPRSSGTAASIASCHFDVLAPWAGTRGYPPYALTDRADARRRLDAVLQRVRRGEDR